MHPDTFSRVALSRVPLIGPKLFRSLIQHFGSAAEVFRARTQELCAVDGIAERTAAGFAAANTRPQREAEAILKHAERHCIQVLSCLDDDYPHRMQPFTGAAPILYFAGEASLSNPRTVAVVGTREMSSQGARQVDRLLDPLADFSPLIISGLAYGVDIYAHRRCLQVGLPTLAVMGSGFDRVYPQAHSKTARQLTENGGGVLTAYPYWMPPEKEHFPARNRVVAMLADLTVVVESATRGGSMITAGMAHDLGRKVGACPGRAGEPLTAGCNDLIKTGRAHLLESGTDIINLLGWKGHAAGRQRRLFDDLAPAERAIIDHLRDREGVEIDELHVSLREPPAKLAGLLLMLEMKGIIMTLPGHRYRLAGG